MNRLRNAFFGSVADPEPLPPVGWAEEKVYLSERFSDSFGPLDLSLTPWIKEPLQKAADPSISRVTLCSGAQVAKTIFVCLALGYFVSQRPGPSMFVMPNKELASKFSTERLKPFFEDCPDLARLIPSNRDLYANMKMQLKTATLLLAGSNSPANLASFPIKYLFLDEIDKFAVATAREASAVALAIKRLTSYSGSKLIRTSTPTVEDGEIWQALKVSDWRKYHVPCPKCGYLQVLDWKRMWWPPELKKPDGRWDLVGVAAETRYLCCNCDAKIDNGSKRSMVNAGQWQSTQAGEPGHAGYHISALYGLWENLDWGRLAVEWLNAQGLPDLLQDFINSRLGDVWKILGKAATEEQILAHRGGYKTGTCPRQPIAVILTADKQEHYCPFVVRAWGPGETSWKIRHGITAGLDQLLDVANGLYTGPGGQPLAVTHRFIDSGNETIEVYRWAAKNRFMPWKGQERSRRTQIFRLAALDSGVILFEFQSDAIKDLLQMKLAIPIDQPGSWQLDDETGLDYALQIAAEEVRVEKDRYGVPVSNWHQIRPDNHWLDCEVAQLAAAMFLGIRFKSGDAGAALSPRKTSVAPHGGDHDPSADAAADARESPRRPYARKLNLRRRNFFRKGDR